MSARGTAVLAVLAVLLAAACGKPTINEEKLDAFLREYASNIGQVKGIGCPSLPSVMGATAECTVDFATGPARKLTVTVDDPAVGHVLIKPVEGLLDRSVLRQAVADKFGGDIALSDLACPENQATAVGTTFSCQATFATTPTPTTLPVEVTGAGTKVDWKIRRTMLKAEVIEADIGKWATAQLTGGGQATAECTADKVLIFSDARTAECTVSAPGVPPAKVQLVADDAGDVRWSFAP